MSNITTSVELKAAILELEYDRTLKGKLLKEEFKNAYESLHPVKLLKNTLSEVFTAPDLLSTLVTAGIGLSAGYFTKRIVVGTSHAIVKNIAGNLLQFGVTKLMMNKPDALKSIGQRLSHLFGRKKDAETELN